MHKIPLKIHPLFIVLGILYLAMGSGYIFFCYFVSVVLHELAHSRIAGLRGYQLREIVLMPYGAVLKGGEDFPRVDALLIAVAGPITNLVIALLIIALWWLVPDVYSATEPLMWANLSLALFNLLPIFPLDGARVILALSHRKARTLRILRVLGIVMSALMMILMIVSIFYEPNFSLGIASIFLMHGALSGTDRELYSHIMSSDVFKKSMLDVVTFLDIGISEQAQLYRFLEAIKSDRIVTFHVLDEGMHEIACLSETMLKDIIMTHELSDRYVDIM